MFDFFISDTHFGHTNIIQYAGRPFTSIEDHDWALEDNYTRAVGNHDTVLWLGDCYLGNSVKFARLLHRLPGRKVLVRGNHDGSHRAMAKLGFAAVMDRVYFRLGGHNVLACHYPPLRANISNQGVQDIRFKDRRPIPQEGTVVMHGHTHEHLRIAPGRLHVGIDAWDYAPVPARFALACLDALEGART